MMDVYYKINVYTIHCYTWDNLTSSWAEAGYVRNFYVDILNIYEQKIWYTLSYNNFV